MVIFIYYHKLVNSVNNKGKSKKIKASSNARLDTRETKKTRVLLVKMPLMVIINPS